MKEGKTYGTVLDEISQLLAENEVTNEEALVIVALMSQALSAEEWRMLTEAIKEQQKKAIVAQTSSPAKV